MSHPDTSLESLDSTTLQAGAGLNPRPISPEYRAWANMKHRAVQVCDRWEKFAAFLEDVGPRPSREHKLAWVERTTPPGPDNCFWSLLKAHEIRVTEEDLTGHRSGRLTAVRLIRSGLRSRWLCACDCGGSYLITPFHLRTQHVKSCGCIHQRHGLQRGPEYSCWSAIRQRCQNPNNRSYHNYGGRGIRVCERWQQFANFVGDMGRKPSVLHSLDRIDVNGHYEPGNCRWATQREQSANRRNIVQLTFNGRTQCLQHWAEELGICGATLMYRLRNWPIERALTESCNQTMRAHWTRKQRFQLEAPSVGSTAKAG